MNTNRDKRAIEFFNIRFGKTPVEAGFPIIDDFGNKCMFIYGTDSVSIINFKRNQNIMNFFRVWYFWPLILAFAIFIFGGTPHIMLGDYTNPWLLIPISFIIVWLIVFIVLMLLAVTAYKKSKDKVIWISF